MSPILYPLLEGLVIAAAISALSFIRREGLPLQVVGETMALALLFTLVMLAGGPFNPVLQFVLTYMIVMRARLLVDVGNMMATRKNFDLADRLYRLALALWPDSVGHMSAHVNLGVNYLRQGQAADAVKVLDNALNTKHSYTPRKLEAAARFNLGVALERTGQLNRAMQEWRSVVQLLPDSIYGYGAQKAIQRGLSPDK